MHSPFPGMDPYLEGQNWKDFHHELISVIRNHLVPALRPKYVPRVELRVYVERVEPPPKAIEPDVFVIERAGKSLSQASPGAVAVAEPYLVQMPQYLEVTEPYLAIYDAADREVITVIEVLSPGNKRAGSEAQQSYLEKREDVLKSWANLVELDLLRGGQRMPTDSPLPPGDDFALVRRSTSRALGEVYSWKLRDPLPQIPIPLAKGDADVVLSLADVFADVYERAGYDGAIDYEYPVMPPLSSDESKWAAEILAAARQRGS